MVLATQKRYNVGVVEVLSHSCAGNAVAAPRDRSLTVSHSCASQFKSFGSVCTHRAHPVSLKRHVDASWTRALYSNGWWSEMACGFRCVWSGCARPSEH